MAFKLLAFIPFGAFDFLPNFIDFIIEEIFADLNFEAFAAFDFRPAGTLRDLYFFADKGIEEAEIFKVF